MYEEDVWHTSNFYSSRIRIYRSHNKDSLVSVDTIITKYKQVMSNGTA